MALGPSQLHQVVHEFEPAADMAPKKKEVKEEKPILGRFSSHLKV